MNDHKDIGAVHEFTRGEVGDVNLLVGQILTTGHGLLSPALYQIRYN